MASRRSESFSTVLFPAYFTSRLQIGSQDIAGREVQISPTRSLLQLIVTFFSCSKFWRPYPSSEFTTRPSNPRHPSTGSSSSKNSSRVGNSGSPMRYNLISLPESCSSACTKYLPSVQSPALSIVITAVPAVPLKPVRKWRHLKNSPTYSDSWKSAVGTRYASIPSSFMRSLNCPIFTFVWFIISSFIRFFWKNMYSWNVYAFRIKHSQSTS